MPIGRRPVNLRLAWTVVEWIDRLAVEEGYVDAKGRPNRTAMIRNLLAYAMRHRPKGWKP